MTYLWAHKSTGKGHKIGLAAVAGATSLLLAACGSGSDDGEAASGGAPTSGDPNEIQATEITGTMYENAISAQYFLAKPAAEEYGLTLESTWETDGAAGMSQLVAGDIDLLQAAPARIADAAKQGIEVMIVAGDYTSAPDFTTLQVLPDSGITSIEQLIGKTVGLPSTVGIQANRLRASLTAEGLDPNEVTFVQVPFGDAPASLQQGNVDAVASQGAITEQLQGIGASTLFDFGGGDYEGRVENVWAVTREYQSENPGTVAAFQCAIVKGGEEANVRANAEGYFRDTLGWTDETIANTASVPSVTGPIDVASIQQDYDDLVTIGVEDQEFDMGSILLPMPENC